MVNQSWHRHAVAHVPVPLRVRRWFRCRWQWRELLEKCWPKHSRNAPCIVLGIETRVWCVLPLLWRCISYVESNPGAIEQDVAGGLTVWWGSTIPVPCQAERTPPYSAALRRLCSVYFVFVFFGFVLLLLLFGPSSLPSFGSLVSSLAHQLEIGMLLCFFSSVFCSILFFSFLVFRLVLSCRPSVGPSTEHITGLIVPASSNLIPSGLGLRHERMFVVVFVSFPLSFLSFRFFPFRFFPFFHYTSLLFRVYLSTMDTYVPCLLYTSPSPRDS